MNKEDFKKNFKIIAKKNSFFSKGSIFYKEFENILVTLDLQRSSFSPLYYLNINVYLKEFLGANFVISSKLKQDITGDSVIFIRTPREYDKFLDLENNISDFDRLLGLEAVFQEFLAQFFNTIQTKDNILSWYKREGLESILSLNAKQQLGL